MLAGGCRYWQILQVGADADRWVQMLAGGCRCWQVGAGKRFLGYGFGKFII